MCDIRIYVADLAAYNAGHLHGVWIDATAAPEEIRSRIRDMLKTGPTAEAEEYAIHDYEGFGSYRLSEYEGLDQVHSIACFIAAHPDTGAALLSHFGDLDEARTAVEERYCGCFRSLADYVQELTEETTQIPESLRHYIDYERMARDLELSGDVTAIETGFEDVHVFWSH